jgi:putative endonuclease
MEGYIYILCNNHRNVLYVGCTNNLRKRLYHHKNRLVPGFTKKYNVHRLVYVERLADMETARNMEQKIKNMNRVKKEALIIASNATWQDLSEVYVDRALDEETTTTIMRGDPSLRSG